MPAKSLTISTIAIGEEINACWSGQLFDYRYEICIKQFYAHIFIACNTFNSNTIEGRAGSEFIHIPETLGTTTVLPYKVKLTYLQNHDQEQGEKQ